MYFDPAIRIYFEKILHLCQDHGVRVVMVRMPMTKEFNIEEGKLVPEEKLFAEVQAITKNYPNFVRALDYHDLFEDHPEYFFDPDHLNIKGADLFSERLAADLAEVR